MGLVVLEPLLRLHVGFLGLLVGMENDAQLFEDVAAFVRKFFVGVDEVAACVSKTIRLVGVHRQTDIVLGTIPGGRVTHSGRRFQLFATKLQNVTKILSGVLPPSEEKRDLWYSPKIGQDP
jgi:hypothetical protein